MTHDLVPIDEQPRDKRRVQCILAVDPGLFGALAFYFPEHDAISAYDMPTVDNDVDCASLVDILVRLAPDVAYVERVASRPGQGVSSMFKFGCGYGMVRGAIAALHIPCHLVTPSKWKRHFSLSSDKEASRELALRMWPARAELFCKKKDHGKAEAALLALFGAKHTRGRNGT